LFKLGWSANRSRKIAMLVCATAVTPIMFAANASHLWIAVALLSLATASHQGWSANAFTLPSDMFPRRAVGSVTGIGGFGGGLGGLAIATITGRVLQFTGSYVPMFVIAGSVYLIALLIVQILVPRLEPADLRA
jgi:ACS family hexuronate transporter-like MFS transporter